MVYDEVVTGNSQGLSYPYIMDTNIKRFVSELPSKNYKTCCCLNAFLLHWCFLPFLFPLPSFFLFSFSPSSCLPSVCVFLPDLKDFQNNKHRYLLASENQRPGNFSTASMGSLTASPSSCSLSSQVGITSVSSIQERIMSTPGGEEAIERLKVGIAVDHRIIE